MPKPVDFLTASGEELRDWYYLHPLNTCMSLAELRDAIAAAAEAKVRGECAEEHEMLMARVNDLRRGLAHTQEASNLWQARAERAEAERDALDRDLQDTVAAKYKAEAALADAERKGGYEALTKLIERIRLQEQPSPVYVINVEHFRDREYAPTPARSVTLVVPLDVELKGNAESPFYRVTITPEQARAIVALAREDGNA